MFDCVQGKIAEHVGTVQQGHWFIVSGFSFLAIVFGWKLLTIPLPFLLAGHLRNRMRRMYRIEGGLFSDFFCACFCPLFTILQEAGEVMDHTEPAPVIMTSY